MDNILLIGGGGHCASVADSLLRTNKYKKIGIVDCNEGASVLGIPFVGTDDNLMNLREEYNYAFVTIGSIGNTILRKKMFSLILSLDYKIPNIIDPLAVVANSVHLGKGVFIGKNSIINSRSKIGDAVIINTGSIVEHDCQIASFVHVSPGAILCGNVNVEESSHIGAGAVVIQGVNIGANAIVGAGTVVIRNVDKDCVVVGNPAKVLKIAERNEK